MLFDCPRCGAHLFFAHAPDCPGRFDWSPDACAFCGKVEEDVDWMVGEPGRRICDACIDVCRRMLDDAAGRSEAPSPDAGVAAPSERNETPAARVPAPASSRVSHRRARRADHCAYCGRHKSEIVRLIAGPKVSICDTCVHDLWVRMAS